MIRQKSNIGKGVRNVVGNGLDFLDKIGGPDSKFPIKKINNKQFTNQDDGPSKNLDGLDLELSMNQKKNYNFVGGIQPT